MVIPLKIKRRDLFSTRQHSYFGVTHYENSKVQKGRKKFFGDRPPPAYLKVRDDRTPPPPPPYLKVWMTAPPLPLISRSGWPHPPPPYLKVWMTAPPLPLISRSGWPHPTPSLLSEGLDPPLYNKSLTRVVFKLGSKVNCVCYGFATPHGDWLFDKTRATFPAKEK